MIIFNQDRLKPLAHKLLTVMCQFKDHPIVFHVFGISGATFMSYIINLIASDDKYEHVYIKGSIYDSAPHTHRILNSTIGIANSIKSNIIFRYLVTVLWLTLIYGQLIVYSLLQSVGIKAQPSTDLSKLCYNTIKSNHYKWPMLFLYSTSDNICHYTDVEEVIDQRKNMGVAVFSKCWGDSCHCGHWTKHQREYEAECGTFLNFCLSNKNKSTYSIQ